MSISVFFNTGFISADPESYLLNNCNIGNGNFGGFYNSSDLLEQNYVFPVSNPDVNTTYFFTTPLLDGNFIQGTRICLESFLIEAGNTNGSQIYIYTVPLPVGSISCDSMPFKDYHFVFFTNSIFNSLSFYHVNDGLSSNNINILNYNKDGNNVLPTYQFEKFDYLGYNICLGTSPSFSQGKTANIIKSFVCNDQKNSSGQ
jgi:hypothetical protein